MARLELTTTLAAPIADVWEALQRPATLAWVSRGWLAFRPIDPPALPARWPRSGDFTVALAAFGMVPIGRQVMGVRRPDVAPPRRALRDKGHGTLVRVWDHIIELTPQGETATRYTDRVRIEAGWLTPLVWLWARGFYAHRQRRWHELVRNGFDTG
ncbi:hypothetical protein [Roseovarius salinarum]|uniref:hypothetical protein n=1 Tax=Roseovarius salinarum TaxID=1981892 RepID=UPI000C3214F5|nr:hypothetical protein [Roseovarius salinarum]